jgi:Lectin C-type domain
MWTAAKHAGAVAAMSVLFAAACGGTSNVNGLFTQGGAGAPIDATAASYTSSGGAAGGVVGATGDSSVAADGGGNSSSMGGSGGGEAVHSDASAQGGAMDAAPSVDAAPPACVPSDELCDGLDNDCNGHADEGNACPDGCVGATFRTSRYMLCYETRVRRSWSSSEEYCAAQHMHLVRIDDADENHFVRQLATDVGYGGDIWIGASDRAREGTWAWTDGTQFWFGRYNGDPVGGRYSNWDSNQPNNATGNEDCVTMWEDKETWHDDNCSIDRAFMCEP